MDNRNREGLIITDEILIHLPSGSYTLPSSLFDQLVRRHTEEGALIKIDQYKDTDERIKPFTPKLYYIDMGTLSKVEVPRVSHVGYFAI